MKRVTRKNKLTAKEVLNRHYCVECAFAKDDMKFENLNLKGEPFMLICPFDRWKKFHNDIACNRFMPKILNN